MTDPETARLAELIGYHLASVCSGNNMPHMSGDPRNRIPPGRRRHFDDACLSAAEAVVSSFGLAQRPFEPFKTAPRDGTPFLCWCPDDVFQPITGYDLIWWETSIRDWTQDGDKPYAPLNKPTLWCPLPTPPALSDTLTTRNNRFCKHDDCPYPDCLVEDGICPSQPVSSPARGSD